MSRRDHGPRQPLLIHLKQCGPIVLGREERGGGPKAVDRPIATLARNSS